MPTRKGINISGNYTAPHILHVLFIHGACPLYFKNLKGRTKSYFTIFLKLNDHPARCFNFRLLSRIHPNDCIIKLIFF